jgi:hypothetical protein
MIRDVWWAFTTHFIFATTPSPLAMCLILQHYKVSKTRKRLAFYMGASLGRRRRRTTTRRTVGTEVALLSSAASCD